MGLILRLTASVKNWFIALLSFGKKTEATAIDPEREPPFSPLYEPPISNEQPATLPPDNSDEINGIGQVSYEEVLKSLVPERKMSLLVLEAHRWLGVRENGGQNKGKDVERFQKAVDGKASGEPWCACFVAFCVKEVDRRYSESFPDHPLMPTSKLYETEHCLTLWGRSPFECRVFEPEEGSIAVWGHYQLGKATGKGHVGIVIGHDLETFHTIEGNTSAGDGINREGDGVYLRIRNIREYGINFKLIGFLRPWIVDPTDQNLS